MVVFGCGRSMAIDQISKFKKTTTVCPSLGSKGSVDLGDGCCLSDGFDGNFANPIFMFLACCLRFG